jgi:sulfur-carrier protein
MKEVTVLYFASLREQRGLDSEVIQTDAANAQELWTHLKTKYNFNLNQEILKVAINETYSSFEGEIKHQDKIVFIPPVAGG